MTTANAVEQQYVTIEQYKKLACFVNKLVASFNELSAQVEKLEAIQAEKQAGK